MDMFDSSVSVDNLREWDPKGGIVLVKENLG